MVTPSSVLFSGLKAIGGINNSTAAKILLNNNATYGGKPLSQRLTVPSFLSRQIVHARPQELPPGIFAPFDQSAQAILRLILEAKGSDERSLNKVAHRYREQCVPAMEQALAEQHVDSMLFKNGVERIETAAEGDIENRLFIHLLFYIATGCLGDPVRAIDVTESCVSERMLSTLGTIETSVGSFFSAAARPAGDARLGLLRVIGNCARPPLRPLSLDPAGTVIGSLTGASHAITDVDPDVSRRHLKIWLEGGRWLAQDLASTNGSKLVSGIDRTERVIAPPHRLGPKRGASAPVEIRNGDTLLLGATTRFLVIRITS